MKALRVLVVAGHPLAATVTEQFDAASGVEVVGCVSSAPRACELLRSLRPDVVAIDLELSGTDGLRLLEQLLEPGLSPVVALSSFAPPASQLALRAVALGATDVIEKLPGPDPARSSLPPELAERVRAAARAHTSRPGTGAIAGPAPQAARLPTSGAITTAGPNRSVPSQRSSQPPAAVVAIGASTGGTVALSALLKQLPAGGPPLLVVQHMLITFTREFAAHLDGIGPMEVREAADGDIVRAGCVLIAPGGQHMSLSRVSSASGECAGTGPLCVRLSDEAPVAKHRPSIDVLFRSCARVAGPSALGVLLTGMGSDGAAGMLEMRRAGARTIVQDEATSAVFGMPKAAISCGAVEQVLPLEQIAPAIVRAARPLK